MTVFFHHTTATATTYRVGLLDGNWTAAPVGNPARFLSDPVSSYSVEGDSQQALAWLLTVIETDPALQWD